MAIYEYRCTEHGITEAPFPMGSAPPSVPCDECGDDAPRSYSSPMVSAVDQRRMGLIDSTKATSDRPDVVTSIPSDGRRRKQRMAPPDPRLQKLPRP